MRAKVIFIAFCLLYLLAGCQQVPDEVKDRMENYGEGGQIENAEVSYCTIEELRNASIEDIDHVPDNLTLPKKVDFSGIESIENLVLKREENYDENKDKIARVFEIENPKWEIVDENRSWYVYEDEKVLTSLEVEGNGEMSYVGGQEYADLYKGQWPVTVERVHFNREECPDMVCSLKDKQIPLSDVLDETQKWVDNCEILQDDFDYELRTAYVKKKEDKTHRIATLFQRMYKGIGLNYIADDYGDEYMENRPYEGSWVIVELDEVNKPSFFYEQMKVNIDEAEPIEQVIDFKSAVKLVEEKLSGFVGISICEIRIEYMIRAEKSENEEMNTQGEEAVLSTQREGAVFHTKPVYSFLIKFDEDDMEDADTLGFIESNEYVYVNVDMTDGTITTNFKERNFHN